MSDFEINFSNASDFEIEISIHQYTSDFDLKILQRVGFEIEKITFSKSYWTRYVFILKKHNTSEFQLKIIQPLRDEVTCGSFQLYIFRLNLKQTLSFNLLP